MRTETGKAPNEMTSKGKKITAIGVDPRGHKAPEIKRFEDANAAQKWILKNGVQLAHVTKPRKP